MKNISNLKTIHSLLVLAALIIFMAAPYVSYGGKYEVSGTGLLEDMTDDDSWLVLFIVTPLLALFANLFNGCTFRQLATLSMGVPIIMLFAKFDYAETAWGSIVHIMLTIGALVTSFLFPNPSNIVAEDEPDTAPAPGNGPTADTPASSTPATPPAPKTVAKKEGTVRAYKTQKLKEIVEDAAMYRPELVERCRQELSIRKKSKAFTEQVAAMDDARLHEILSDRTQYAEELIYACEREQSRRRRAQLEQQKLQQEQLRIQQEQQAEAERQVREQRAKEEAERQAARNKKMRKYLIIGTILLALITIGVSVAVSISRNEFFGKSAQECYKIGRCYAFGSGVPYDVKEAVKWYEHAAKKGNAEAQNALGVCYEQGVGVVQNYYKAFEYYLKAAKQDLVLGQINVAECYERGKGVTQNIHEARFWYKKAADQGSETARQGLLRCQ